MRTRFALIIFAVLIAAPLAAQSTGKSDNNQGVSLPKDRQVPVVGEMRPADLKKYLKSIGDEEAAKRVSERPALLGGEVDAWRYTDHKFGFIPKTAQMSAAPIDIADAGTIQADQSLKGANVKVTLDHLRVFDYPGKGEHIVLFDFYAEHQPSGSDPQGLHFTQKYRAIEGGGAGVSGFPVFLSLKVPASGLNFKGFTVNVENTSDKNALAFMESETFTNGVKMLSTVNPLVPVVSGFATGLAKMFLKRNENKAVQDFYMGLDFSGSATRAQLKEGSYIIVQAPPTGWDWSKYQFVPTNDQFEVKGHPGELVPFNYVVISITKE